MINMSNRACIFYKSKTGCRYGDRCRFVHEGEAEPQICHYYGKPGGCRYGSDCRYAHVDIHETNPVKEANISALSMENKTRGAAFISILVPNNNMNANFDDEDEDEEEDDEENYFGDDKDDSEELTLEKENMFKKASMNKTIAVCRSCDTKFDSNSSLIECYQALFDHYMANLLTFNFKHLQIIRRHSSLKNENIMCPKCYRMFDKIVHLICHVKDKVKNDKKSSEVQIIDTKVHKNLLNQITHLFVEKDLLLIDEEKFVTKILIVLKKTESDFNLLNTRCMISNILHRYENYGDYDSEEDDGYLGFTGSEVEELLCQGIKPWDDDAHIALAAINGYY